MGSSVQFSHTANGYLLMQYYSSVCLKTSVSLVLMMFFFLSLTAQMMLRWHSSMFFMLYYSKQTADKSSNKPKERNRPQSQSIQSWVTRKWEISAETKQLHTLTVEFSICIKNNVSKFDKYSLSPQRKNDLVKGR